MKIKTCKLRAADCFRAKGDVRYYLNGIHINKDFIEAANGHIAIRMKSDLRTRMDVIIRFKGAIPKSAEDTKLEFSKGKNIAYHYDSFGELVNVQMFEVESGKFPDLSRVIPNDFSLGSEFPMLNAEYMAVAHKAFGGKKDRFIGMKVVHFDGEGGVVVYAPQSGYLLDHGEPLILIMPMRQ